MHDLHLLISKRQDTHSVPFKFSKTAAAFMQSTALYYSCTDRVLPY